MLSLFINNALFSMYDTEFGFFHFLSVGVFAPPQRRSFVIETKKYFCSWSSYLLF